MNLSTARSSGSIAAAAATVVSAQRTLLRGLMVISDGTNTATGIVYDNASAASGTVLARATATTTQGFSYVSFPAPVQAENGITIAVTGTGTPTAIVYFGG